MVSTFTTNKSLEKPATGDQVGTWGSQTVNPNMDKIDAAFGGVTTIALTNSPITLSSGQYVNTFIRFTGAITANCAVTFPPVGSFYTVINDTTNSSAFVVTAKTSVAGGRTIGLPNGMTQIMTDGTDARYSTLPPVGTYLDYAGTTLPLWVTASTVPPYLNCDGTAFSSATYPTLASVLGSVTLPDLRGRVRAYLNQGTGRMTSASGGVDGNTLKAAGGQDANGDNITQNMLDNFDFIVSDPGHTHTYEQPSSPQAKPASGGTAPFVSTTTTNTGSATTGITVNSGGNGDGIGWSSMQPTCVGGITMIRGG